MRQLNLKALLMSVVCACFSVTHAISSDTANNALAENLADLAGNYVIDTQILMPNLEENLRYANSTVTRCLSQFVPDDLFPILSHKSLNGCKLIADKQEGHAFYFTLKCTGTNQTQGYALLRSDGAKLSGTVNVQMGGKNMTFSQRIAATETEASESFCEAIKQPK